MVDTASQSIKKWQKSYEVGSLLITWETCSRIIQVQLVVSIVVDNITLMSMGVTYALQSDEDLL